MSFKSGNFNARYCTLLFVSQIVSYSSSAVEDRNFHLSLAIRLIRIGSSSSSYTRSRFLSEKCLTMSVFREIKKLSTDTTLEPSMLRSSRPNCEKSV